MSKVDVLRQLWSFMRENKKFWLAPIVIVLVLVGLLLVVTQGSAVAPFIYTLF
jgi:competence protein ComGC